MAVGTQTLGSAAVIRIGTSSSPTTVIGGLVSANLVRDAGTTDRKYYDGTASSVAVGELLSTVSLTIDNMAADSGQLILRDAVESKAIIWVKVLPDGINGQTIPVRASHDEFGFGDVTAFTTGALTLNQAGTPVDVAGGFGA